MALFPIKTFLGLRTGVSDPEVGTASLASNFRRNRVRGQLELSDGAATNLTFSPTTYGITLLTAVAFKSFYVADEGGRTITAVLATYHKATAGFSGSDVESAGIFIRPYYTGAGWVDDWREVTEFAVLRYASKTGSTITVENSPSLPFGNNYLDGWTLIKAGDQSLTEDTGILITSQTGAVLTCAAATTQTYLTSWVPNTTLLYAVRGLYGQTLPHSVVPHLRRLLDELRVSTGNGTSDIDAAVFYRDKTFFTNNNLIRKGTYGERGNFVVPVPAFGPGSLSVDGSTPSDGLPVGTYAVKTSVVSDDGQESDLRSTIEASTTGILSHVYSQAGGGVVIPGVRVGNYQYSLGNYVTGKGFTEIYQYDLTTQTLTKTVTNANGFRAITTDGTWLYVIYNTTSTHYLYIYDTGLNLQVAGTGVTTGGGYFAGYYMGVSGNYVIGTRWYSTPNSVAPILDRWTKAGTFVDSITLTGVHDITGIACDGTDATKVWVPRADSSTYHVSIVDTTTGTMSENVVSLTGVTVYPQYGTYYGGKAYVSCGTKIISLTTGGVQATFNPSTGNVATGSMTNNGVYLYLWTSSKLVSLALASGNEAEVCTPGFAGTLSDNMVGYVITGVAAGNIITFQHLPSNATFYSGGQLRFSLKVLVSPGLIPIRAKYVRVWLSKDSGPYYLVKTYTMLQDTTGDYLNFDTGVVWNATQKHYYYQSQAINIGAADWSNAQNSATTQLGRLETDKGEARYTFALTANNRTYIVGRTISNRLQRNRVYLSALSGDGVSQYDIYPNDVQYVLDVEFNDGDSILALGNVADRILVLKNRSLVMLTPNADGSHNRDIVATGVGIAAVNSLIAYNEALYWLDHSGVWEFSTRGLRKMSAAIDNLLFALTNAQRAAAIAAIDPKNTAYKVLINGTIYVCDLADGEWTTEVGASQLWFDFDLGFGTGVSTSYDQNSAATRRYAQLVGSTIQTPREDVLTAAATWQTNNIELPLERGYDGLLNAIYVDYDMQGTTPTATLSLYLDDNGSPAKQYTLPTGKYEVTIATPLAARCKTFKLHLTMTPTSGQKFRLRRAGAYFSQILVGGDRHSG